MAPKFLLRGFWDLGVVLNHHADRPFAGFSPWGVLAFRGCCYRNGRSRHRDVRNDRIG